MVDETDRDNEPTLWLQGRRPTCPDVIPGVNACVNGSHRNHKVSQGRLMGWLMSSCLLLPLVSGSSRSLLQRWKLLHHLASHTDHPQQGTPKSCCWRVLQRAPLLTDALASSLQHTATAVAQRWQHSSKAEPCTLRKANGDMLLVLILDKGAGQGFAFMDTQAHMQADLEH